MSSNDQVPSSGMDTPEWRAHVESKITGVENRIGGVERQLEIGGRRFDSFKAEIQENTRLTTETRDEFRKFAERATPTIEITEPMLRGAALLGKCCDAARRFASFVNRWTAPFIKLGVAVAASWLAFKVLVSGGGWGEAVKVFFTGFGK